MNEKRINSNNKDRESAQNDEKNRQNLTAV